LCLSVSMLKRSVLMCPVLIETLTFKHSICSFEKRNSIFILGWSEFAKLWNSWSLSNPCSHIPQISSTYRQYCTGKYSLFKSNYFSQSPKNVHA
jgi:hypothetical protein